MMQKTGIVAAASRLLLRDWRGGELGILVAALVLAVTVVVGISVFVARLQSALESGSSRLLAADMVVSSTRELPGGWLVAADQQGLAVSTTTEFSSMVYTDRDAMVLSSVKAVADSYPLRGQLLASVDPFGPIDTVTAGPGPGEAWLAPRLFALLDVQIGDRVYVGELALRVSGAVRGEPDASRSVFGLGPRLMMHVEDIAATRILQPGSRVSYRLLLSGDRESLTQFRQQIEPNLSQGQRLLTVQDSQPRIGRTLDRARGFLLLAGSLGVVLAAAAVSLAARRFSERHADYVAIMKSLGASSAQVSGLYGVSLVTIGAAATAMGCLTGWMIQWLFFQMFNQQLPVQPGDSGVTPYLMGAAAALVCLLVFAWPPLRRLSAVPPIRVLRRDAVAPVPQRPRDYWLGGLSIAALLWWYSGDWRMTGGLLVGLLVTVGAGYLVARVLLMGTRQVGARAGSMWLLAVSGLQRRSGANALQMTIFAVAIMLLLVLAMVRTSLLEQWATQLPVGTPNHFLLNIAGDKREAVAAFLQDRGISQERLYPLVRGRVMAVNDLPLAASTEDDGAPRQREANFTWAEAAPAGNVLLEGGWWSPGDTNGVSLEQGFAQRIGAKMGDLLTVQIGAENFTARVSSIREVDWQTMQPNFFVIFPPPQLQRYPATYMTSFFLPADQKSTLNQLVRAFPTVSVIELDVVIDEIQGIIDRVGQAIELVLAVILLAGGLVLVAGIQSSVDVRLRESALLRALGARSALLTGALWIEFTVLGAMAGALAVAGAEASAWLLQTEVLTLDYRASPHFWPMGILGGGLLVGALGTLACRRAINAPPLMVLRDVQ